MFCLLIDAFESGVAVKLPVKVPSFILVGIMTFLIVNFAAVIFLIFSKLEL